MSETTPVRGDVSAHERLGYIRRDITLREGDEGWAPKATVATRKKGPPPEIPGDAYDRQRVIPDFDQTVVQRQVCLVLGAGGIGQNVALVLARLGVREIILVDNDVYDASNLNRQCLGSAADVGRRKVDIAADGVTRHIASADTTKVTPVHVDVITDWKMVVMLARRSDVIFNGIDIGCGFDTAVGVLGKDLGKPVVVGQSYGWSYTAEYYDGQPGTVSAFDDSVRKLFDIDVDDFGGRQPSDLLQEDILASWCVSGPIAAACAAEAAAAASEFIVGYRDAALARLAPSAISTCNDLAFLPVGRNKVPTRFVGSWVVPCLGCATQMVGQWMNALTGPTERGRTPGTFSDMDVPAGMSQAESTGRSTAAGIAAWGEGMSAGEVAELMLPSKQSCSDASTHPSSEALCRRAERLRDELFMGSQPAFFVPVPGEVAPMPSVSSVCANDILPPALPDGIVIPDLPTKPLAIANLQLPAGGLLSAPGMFVSPVLKTSAAKSTPLATVGGWTAPQGGGVTQQPLAAVTSGKRSALLKYAAGDGDAQGSRWLRLKGCGNGEDGGFTLEKHGDRGELTPRGCGFQDSVLLELEMCRRIHAKTGLDVANTPIGYFQYAVPNDPTPSIPKYCGVFETLGDKRAGDHLLAGLVQLAAVMLPASECARAEAGLRAARGVDEEEDILPTDMAAACEMPIGDCSGTELHEIPPAFRPDDVCWNNAVERLQRNMLRSKYASETKSVLLHLAKRLGWECGFTLRKFQEAGISWGTFRDALGTHCNAHVNNLVVRRIPGEYLLAPLDFDMAFDEELYIESKGIGPLDEVFAFERAAGMRQVLAGSDFASTGVSGKVELDAQYTHVKTAIHDTVVAAYDAGLAGAPSPWVPELNEVVSDIIVLCLTLTRNVVA